MANHEHRYHEATDSPLACPDDMCWWNEEENHIGLERYTELTVTDGAEWPSAEGASFDAHQLAEPWTVNGAEVPFGDILRQAEGPEFPEGFQGSGPMLAAIPLGEPWLKAATEGATTYVLHDPYSFRGPDEAAQELHEKYAGRSAFLDRHQVEQVADHPDRSGEFYRWEGLTGVPDCTARREAEIAEDVDWVSQLDGFFSEAS